MRGFALLFLEATRLPDLRLAALLPAQSRFLLASPKPDIVLLDITAGLTFGSLTEVHAHLPDTPVVLWAEALPLDLVFKTFELGVRGIVQRTAVPEQLVDSLAKVALGEMQIGFGTSRDVAPMRKKVTLTPREREIVGLACRGSCATNRSAADMNITEGTVKIYLFRLFHKLSVRKPFRTSPGRGILDRGRNSRCPTPSLGASRSRRKTATRSVSCKNIRDEVFVFSPQYCSICATLTRGKFCSLRPRLSGKQRRG